VLEIPSSEEAGEGGDSQNGEKVAKRSVARAGVFTTDDSDIHG
jgi:hypothetical protein